MNDHQIWMYGDGVSRKLDLAERSLTAIRDKLDVLGTGAEMLAGYWDSSAYRQWYKELIIKLERIKDCTEKMGQLLFSVSEIAGMLADAEKRNHFLIELSTTNR